MLSTIGLHTNFQGLGGANPAALGCHVTPTRAEWKTRSRKTTWIGEEYCRKSTKCSNHASQGILSRALFEYCHAHKYFWALIFKKIASDFKFLPNMEKKSPKFEHFNRLSLIFFLLSRWALAKKSSHKFPAEQLVDFLQYIGNLVSARPLVPSTCHTQRYSDSVISQV